MDSGRPYYERALPRGGGAASRKLKEPLLPERSVITIAGFCSLLAVRGAHTPTNVGVFFKHHIAVYR